MHIEDTLYYPAVNTVSPLVLLVESLPRGWIIPLVAVAHAEHRAVSDQLATALRTKVSSDDFPIEWGAFTTTHHHPAPPRRRRRTRHVPPRPPPRCDAQLGALGAAMTSLLERRRRSRRTQLRVRVKSAVLRRL